MVESAACISALPDEQRVIWDGTAGLAGHAMALSRAYPGARVLASDADAEMLALVRESAEYRAAMVVVMAKRAVEAALAR